MAKRGDVAFVITQSTADVQVLHYIQNTLGFGKVNVQSSTQRTHRFVVQDLNNLYLLALLFNGNLVFPLRAAKFQAFLANINVMLVKRGRPILAPILETFLPTLEDSWICGITDAEGSYSCSILSNSKAYRIRYILTQKGEANIPVLLHLAKLFGIRVRVEPHHVKDVFEIRVNGVANCNRILPYFDNTELRTHKKDSYMRFKQMLILLDKQYHLNEELRPELSKLAKLINNHSRSSSSS